MKSTENGDFAGHLKFDFRQSNSETVMLLKILKKQIYL